HVIGELRVEHPLFLAFLLVIGENPIVSFAAPQDRVNRGVERLHAVVGFAGSSVQPFDITVWPGNVAVGAGCNVDDDFSICFHETLTFWLRTTPPACCLGRLGPGSSKKNWFRSLMGIRTDSTLSSPIGNRVC